MPMASPYDKVPEELLKDAAQASGPGKTANGGKKPKQEQPKITGAEKKQHRLFKKKRAGVVLSEDEVKEIKAGRKKLRKEMRQRGIKSKREFELVAGGLGLYFDKRGGLLLWLFRGRVLWALLGSLLALLGVFFLMSTVSQMRGYFTINLSDGMFKEGFVLSDTVGFENPQVNLYCEPATDVPCISIIQIDENVDEIDGPHNGDYFAYTFYCRNEGESTVDYAWELELTDESKNLSTSAWVMVFEDGKQCFYAEADPDTGREQALPAFDDNGRGYLQTPMIDQARYPDQQYQTIRQKNGVSYYRLIPFKFQSEDVVTSGLQEKVAPGQVHKYTVVIWLEGDDPHTTNERINGHLGLAMQFRLLEEQENAQEQSSWWQRLWSKLKWW